MTRSIQPAAVKQFGKAPVLRDWDIASPGPSQILMKTEACGVCHTDRHAARGEFPAQPERPFIPGHEGIGRVAAVGAGVMSVKQGDRVGVPWLQPGEFAVPLFDLVSNCITLRGSFVGTRQDRVEALAFAANGQVQVDIELQPPSAINHLFDRLERGEVATHGVLDFRNRDAGSRPSSPRWS